ncbi:echinoidin [Strongylocentrotus purpuratus]|uniref:C-type lectin domain-containing protein n=1 Tax=Strongylocentrotus purpuratus TaxID=7668 RepID=A0A7M7TG31_STRPU|nr:echinoidin [Strongylocentrotus purpuratus]XP_780871.3 echinoidin [Strongylocentrotus purpuratus]|eukprot:XP_011677413.1 PREDICTED: echinoidin [Strongylocentrotus purpuratus]
MKLLLTLMTLAAVALFGLPEATGQCACSSGWSSFAGNCYRYFTQKVNWQAAQNACQGLGANLVSMHDEAENTFAYALILTDGCDAPTGEDGFAWIGYHQPNGPFVWSDGSSNDYTNWAENQPDNYNHGYATEDCGHLRNVPSGSWNDFPCNKQIGYICKK